MNPSIITPNLDYNDWIVDFLESIGDFIGTLVEGIVSFFRLLFGLQEWGTPVLSIFPSVILSAYLLIMIIAVIKAILGR